MFKLSLVQFRMVPVCSEKLIIMCSTMSSRDFPTLPLKLSYSISHGRGLEIKKAQGTKNEDMTKAEVLAAAEACKAISSVAYTRLFR